MKMLQYKNTTISYKDQGKGTAVVLLHGFLENQTMWDELVPVLSNKCIVISRYLLESTGINSSHIVWFSKKP